MDRCVCEAEGIESAFCACVLLLIDYSWFSLISCHIRPVCASVTAVDASDQCKTQNQGSNVTKKCWDVSATYTVFVVCFMFCLSRNTRTFFGVCGVCLQLAMQKCPLKFVKYVQKSNVK